MQRYYGRVSYIWTVEVQEERALKIAERILHWHILIAFPAGTPFGKEDVLRIQKYWKYGNVDIKPVRKADPKYLLKYIQKALAVRGEEFYKLKKLDRLSFLRG